MLLDKDPDPPVLRRSWWFTCTMDNFDLPHLNYREAVKHAQNKLGTNARPKRIRAGFYILKGPVSDTFRRELYICTGAAAVREGFGFGEMYD